MLLARAVDEPELRAELPMQRFRCVAHHVESAAARRAIRREARDDDMAAWSDRMSHLSDVSFAVVRIREEMKDGSVVPDCVGSV